MNLENVLWERDGGVVTITMNRPGKLNAQNLDMMHSLIAAFEEVERDDSIKCAIWTGAGRGWSAGRDFSDPKLAGVAPYGPEIAYRTFEGDSVENITAYEAFAQSVCEASEDRAEVLSGEARTSVPGPLERSRENVCRFVTRCVKIASAPTERWAALPVALDNWDRRG